MTRHVRTFVLAACALVAAGPASAADGKVVVVRAAEAAVISDIVEGFRSAYPGAAFEDVLLTDAKSEAALAKRLDGATSILSIGTRSALAVAKAKPAGKTIAIVPPSQADPVTLGTTMRLQPPADGLIASISWMSTRFRKVAVVFEGGAVERQKIAELEASKRGIVLTTVLAKDARAVVTAVSDLVTKSDVVMVDVSEGLQKADVEFILRAAQEAKIPLLGTSEGFVKAGAPGAITIDPKNVGAEAGRLAKDGASGLFDPKRFRMLVNLVVMDRLGVSVSNDRGNVENNILVIDTDVEEIGKVTRPITMTKPAVKKSSGLTWPPVAHSSIRTAEVQLEVTIRADGTVGETKVLKGDAMFATAAVDSLKSWQFKPGTRDGTPIDASLRLNLKFQK